jgi:lipopolysaccharide export system protein LptA
MASTVRSLSARLFGLASLALAGAVTAAGAAGPAHTARSIRPARSAHSAKPSGPISLDASHTAIDYKTHHARLRNVVITQGDLKVSAEHADATGLNFKNSRWLFTGNVHINSPDHGILTSDTATIEFRDEQMQTAEVTGSPAKFEQTVSTTGALARGHADSIVYTVAADTVQLKGDAWLQYGDNEITGPVLVYDIASQKLEGAGAAGEGERVHITIRPKSSAKARKGTMAAPARSPGKTPP